MSICVYPTHVSTSCRYGFTIYDFGSWIVLHKVGHCCPRNPRKSSFFTNPTFLVPDRVLAALSHAESIITQHLSLSKLARPRCEIYGLKILRSLALRSGDKPRKSVTSFCACCAETGAISSFPFSASAKNSLSTKVFVSAASRAALRSCGTADGTT